MKEKIVSIIFICMICVMGLGTVAKMPGDPFDVRKKEGLKGNIANFEAWTNEHLKSRNNWIDLNGAFQRIIGSTYVKDPSEDVYKLDDGSIMYNVKRQDMKPYIREVRALAKRLKEYGVGGLTYVQIPYKIQSDDMLPVGMKAYGNHNADDLLQGMASDPNIKPLDLRECVTKEGLNHKDIFFKTDHHWLPTTALWAADKITDTLNESYGLAKEKRLFKLKNFDRRKYSDWFLGSLGKRTGRLYAGVDDFDFITPKWHTDFTFDAEAEKGHLHREGDFKTALCAPEYLDKRNYFKINCYATYTGGDYKINTVINNTAFNDDSLLMFRDSFSCALEPFICNQYKKVTAVDMRYYDGDKLTQKIRDGEYDAVMIVYNPSAFSETQFDFERVID